MFAIEPIQDAYARLNRLSPGETLGADEASFAFTRLNLLVDEMSADNLFLYQDNNTSAAVTGTITLGTGAWAAVAPGAEIIAAQIVNASSGNLPLTRIDYAQYRQQVYQPAIANPPRLWTYDGLSTVFFYPVPTAVTIQLQTRTGVSAFADQNVTAYTVPPGYKSLLGAELAVRLAPSVLGGVPPALEKAAKACHVLVSRYTPAIVDVHSYSNRRCRESILYG